MSKPGVWRRLTYALGLAALLIVSLASAPPALAHASLVGAQPADGELDPLPPETLKLDFNEPVTPLIVRLVSPSGAVITPKVTAENNTLTITPPALGRGTHVLSYRVISADGHPVGGAVMFSVGTESARPEAGAVETDPAVATAIWTARILIYLGLFVGVGGAAFIALLAQARPLPGRAEKWIAAAMIGGLVATALSVGLQGLDALAQPLGQLWQPDIWQSGLATSYGWSAAAAVLAQLLGLAALRLRHSWAARLCAAAALAGVGLVLSASGHAATVEPQLWSRGAVFLHAVSIAFWVGSLIPLMVIVRDGSRGNGELAAFSRIIPLPLAVLIATGAYLAFIELDRPDALWTTRYGEVLSFKLAMVLILLALAAANRYVLVPRLSVDAAAAPRRLATAIAAESAIVLAILFTVATWRFTPPPRALIAAEATTIHFHDRKAMAQIDVEPVRARGAEVGIEVLDGKLHPLSAKEVTIFLSNPDAGIESVRRDAVSLGTPRWHIDDLRIPVAGRWKMRVDILVDDFDKVTLEDDVVLPRTP
jgi:copper transport protein